MAGSMLFQVYVQILLHYTVFTGFISRGDLVKKAVGYWQLSAHYTKNSLWLRILPIPQYLERSMETTWISVYSVFVRTYFVYLQYFSDLKFFTIFRISCVVKFSLSYSVKG